MARLPQPGGDAGNWGDILNDYLTQSHATDGTLKPDIIGNQQLQDNAVTAATIADGSITTANLAADAVTRAKLDSAVRTELDTYVDTTTANAAYAPIQGSTKYPTYIMPQAHGAVADSVTDDGPAINAALTAAQTAGTGVYLPAGTYRVRTMINVNGTNVRLFGAGIGKTIIKVYGETSIMNRVIGHTTDVNGLTVTDMTFEGTVIDDVSGPRRSRTSTSNGFNSALQVSGNLAPNVSTVVRDVRIERVEVRKSHGLPMLFSGVRGESRVESCRSVLTMDWGWTWCERAICVNSASFKGADNGFSLSRGCLSALAVGNTVDSCAYFGIWVSGFNVTGQATDHGPVNFVVTGNTITNAGRGGIHADNAPKNGSITGNVVNGLSRGASDEPTNIYSVGVYVGGFPDTNRPVPTAFAENITVSGNTLIDCARGGVLVAGAKNIMVTANTIIRPGSQYLADGTTTISSTDLDNNFGVSVMFGAQSTTTNLSVIGNTIIDDRTTPYSNYAWYTSGSTSPYVSGNVEKGTRQSAVLTHDNGTGINHSGVHTYQSNIKYTAGATAGANGAAGTVAGFDINGAAGSARIHQFLTAGNKRWTIRASGDAESGSNAGTRYQIDAYDDAGTLIKSMMTLTRDGKIGFNGASPVTPPTLPAAATDAATTQALANSLRTTLINLGLAA